MALERRDHRRTVSREFLDSNGAAEAPDRACRSSGTVCSPQWSRHHLQPERMNEHGDRPERLLQQGPFRALRQHHRRGHRAHALRRSIPAAPRTWPWWPSCPCDGETTTCSGMAWGFNPYLMSAEPVSSAHGMAVVDSRSPSWWPPASSYEDAYLTFQEYFETPARRSPSAGASRWPPCWVLWMPRWVWALRSIGGKDSMSGSFEQLDVPPTLVSFATGHRQGQQA